ncbi:GNAT family N-acetyltransferase [Acinetobacter sp. EC24]|nr:GNAT family N-acetyltransferase [Acinetobacter rathckeae]MBF7695872.1 GNAT family N-acetyltransferase [Acinetobacter rathckeae]
MAISGLIVSLAQSYTMYMIGRAFITGNNGKKHFTVDSIGEDRFLWVLARNEKGDAVGYATIRPLTEGIAEVKRMFSSQSSPGIGYALLTFLEKSAKAMGYNALLLETRKVNTRAVKFYRKNGYISINNYGPYVGRDEAICFSKNYNLHI